MSDVKVSTNRALNVRRDMDTEKNFSITLLDIDTAIMSHIDNYIGPTVISSGNSVKVPIMYATPEKWKAMKKDGNIRDNQGKMQYPIIAFSRTGFAQNENIMSLNRYLSFSVMSKFDRKNRYDRFDLLNSTEVPNNQVYNVTLPDYITVTYEFAVFTELQEQMNGILEKINFAVNEYWGDPKRFKFRVKIDDYTNTIEYQGDRIVKSEFTLTAFAYLLPESFEDKKSTTIKSLTPRVLKITSEVVSSVEMEKLKKSAKDSRKPYPYSYLNGSMVSDKALDAGEISFPTPSLPPNTHTSVVPRYVESLQDAYKQLIFNSNCDPSRFVWHTAPTKTTDYGEEGWMAYDGDFHYLYTNYQWKRYPIADFSTF